MALHTFVSSLKTRTRHRHVDVERIHVEVAQTEDCPCETQLGTKVGHARQVFLVWIRQLIPVVSRM